MKDYDAGLVEDRTFKLGGEVFTYRLFHYTETVEMLDDRPSENDLVIGEDGTYSFKLDIEWTLGWIYKYLEPDSAKRLKTRLGKKTDPIPHITLVDVYRDLRQKVQALPTSPPSSEPSANGGGSTEAESSEGSLSTEAKSTA